MRTLGDAWHEAYVFLDALPYSRTPVLTLSYSKNINGHPPVSNGYVSLQMTPAERKGGELRFWSHRAYDRTDPITAIDECIAAAKAFLQPESDTVPDPFS